MLYSIYIYNLMDQSVNVAGTEGKVGGWFSAGYSLLMKTLLEAGLQIYGGPGSLSHDFKIWPVTFQGSGPILFGCENISL